VRNGLNFTERGFGVRGAVGVSDRGHTAVSQLKRGDINWKKIFKDEGARWFHCGGIFAALSESTPDVAREAMECAKENGTIVSYDLNYRPSLWKAIGGSKRAIEVNRGLAPFIDVMIGNEEDFTAALGFEVPGLDAHCSNLDPANFKRMIDVARAAFPNFQAIATTLRHVKSASINDWGAVLWTRDGFFQSQARTLEILDRVGGGDSFASGPDLRLPRRSGSAIVRGIRCRPRRAGHDHAGRHLDGDAGRGEEPSPAAAAPACSADASAGMNLTAFRSSPRSWTAATASTPLPRRPACATPVRDRRARRPGPPLRRCGPWSSSSR
jgi:hypothetical protein